MALNHTHGSRFDFVWIGDDNKRPLLFFQLLKCEDLPSERFERCRLRLWEVMTICFTKSDDAGFFVFKIKQKNNLLECEG